MSVKVEVSFANLPGGQGRYSSLAALFEKENVSFVSTKKQFGIAEQAIEALEVGEGTYRMFTRVEQSAYDGVNATFFDLIEYIAGRQS